jgi:hypothetical protein
MVVFTAFAYTHDLMKTKSIILVLVAVGSLALSSCVPLAVGAGAGYVAHKEGYRVQNPVTKH